MFRRAGMCCHEFWGLFKVFWQLLYGIWRLSRLHQPIVSVFGGARLTGEDPYFKKAHILSERFVDHDISVVTGGGPGVMEAAGCGAVHHKKTKARSIGIAVKDLGEGKNPCVQEYFELDYFFARKWLLINYSIAFIVFPGGYGTLDELAEVLTLSQTKKLKQVPIVLIGVEYWAPFMSWIKQEALKHNLVSYQDLELFTITDDLDEAFRLVHGHCVAHK
jgi:uncharacterized protein (TIGR00730 family)